MKQWAKELAEKLYAGLFEALAGENINRIVGGYTLPNDGSAKLHEFFGFKNVGIFTEVGYKFGKYWDVQWTERPLRPSNQQPSISEAAQQSLTRRNNRECVIFGAAIGILLCLLLCSLLWLC